MNNLNSLLIEGFVTSDPELSYTEKGDAVCRFKLENYRAHVEESKKVEEVSYFDIVTHLRLAEVCAEHLKKGRGVRIVGRLKQETEFIDVGDGPNCEISNIWIEAEHVEFKPKKETKK